MQRDFHHGLLGLALPDPAKAPLQGAAKGFLPGSREACRTDGTEARSAYPPRARNSPFDSPTETPTPAGPTRRGSIHAMKRNARNKRRANTNRTMRVITFSSRTACAVRKSGKLFRYSVARPAAAQLGPESWPPIFGTRNLQLFRHAGHVRSLGCFQQQDRNVHAVAHRARHAAEDQILRQAVTVRAHRDQIYVPFAD